MTGASIGRKRRRIYVRKFDWADARARYAGGETMTSIAKSYGVNQSAVKRVIAMPEHLVGVATPQEVSILDACMPGQVPCPRCERPKARSSALCQDCFNETREMSETRLERIPGKKRVVLGDVLPGRIVCVDKRWGVVVKGPGNKTRLVDFWDGGLERVSDITIVQTAPATRVYVGDVVEEPEEIAA